MQLIERKNMKGLFKIVLIIIFLTGANFGFAQKDSTQPVYLRFPTIPQFTIFNVKDSSLITRDNLKKKRPTVLIIFSPDCEHCQKETKDLEANITKFKNAQILMVTYLPFEEMRKFYKEYNIANYPMITMGRDAKFFFPVFYKLKSLPAIFVYDKKGNLKKSFEGSVSVLKVAAEL